MVLVLAQLCLSLVLFPCHSFDLFFRGFISSLPVPSLSNFCSASFVSFYSLPIPAPGNICLITCLLISSLPEPFPDNSVLSFVWIRLVSTTPAPDYAFCLLLLYHSFSTPGFDPRLFSGPPIGYLDYDCLPPHDSGLLLFSGLLFQ